MASRPPKRRRLTPPEEGPKSKLKSKSVQKAFLKNAASWDLEQDYESRPRKGKNKKESTRLPVKSLDGRVEQLRVDDDDAVSVGSNPDWLGSDAEEDSQPQDSSQHAPQRPQEPALPPREQIRRAQEELAKLATQLNENPEENPGAFRSLARVGQSKLPAVQKLCLVTRMAVYRDVIPGYRIRQAAEDAPPEKLSKEVRTLRGYEQALVAGYQAYIKELAAFAAVKSAGAAARDLADVAITCACTLLNAVPHFNFRGELLRILVRKLSSRVLDRAFARCRDAIETMFREDEEGAPSLEAVTLLSKMMKVREYRVDESVLNLFLRLRLLSEFSGKASQDGVDRPANGAPNGAPPLKGGKKHKEFRTKRERKALKEQKSVEKDMAHADALVSHEERERMQSDTLKLVFATYFRILKLRSPRLMGAVLEGLAKYAHLINQNFFGDLLEALKDLIRHSEEDGGDADGDDEDGDNDDDDDDTVTVRNPSREALLCTVTAFALLSGQDAHNSRTDLHLDLSFFTAHLYQSLLALSLNPDLELNAKSLHLPDPDAPSSSTPNNKVNLETLTVLLLRCLGGVLLPPWNIRSVPPLRLAAFSKLLMSAALQMPEKSCQAVLALLDDVANTHGAKIRALWNTEERRGDGTFHALSSAAEASNPFATTVWEGEILRRHYCPKVRERVKLLEKRVVSS